MQGKRLIAAALLAVGLTALFVPVRAGQMPLADARIFGVVLVSIVLWATNAIPNLLVSLLFFFLSATITDVPASAIFSGFASSAFWLVFSGAAIGFALNESGLSSRVGAVLARRIGGSYLKALMAFAVLSFLLSLVMPSTFGRIAILIPIAMGYCGAVGLDETRRGRYGILLLVIVGSYELAASVLPANLPNVIMAGVVEQSHGMNLRFSEYLFYFLPAGVIARGAVLVYASYRLFADRVDDVPPRGVAARITGREVHVIMLLAATLAFWLTDSIHHVAPGWVGLGFTLAYFLTSPPQHLTRFTSGLKMDLLWFIAAIIGLTALIDHVDMGVLRAVASGISGMNPLLMYAVLSGVSIALCFFVTSNAEPALFVPAAGYTLQHGAWLKAGMLSQVMGYGTTFLPYQSPPVAFGIELAQIDRGAALKYCVVTAVLALFIVMPVNGLWWRWIGLL